MGWPTSRGVRPNRCHRAVVGQRQPALAGRARSGPRPSDIRAALPQPRRRRVPRRAATGVGTPRAGGRRSRGSPAHLLEEAPLELDGAEVRRVAQQHLGLAEEQHAVGPQREVQAVEDLRLGLGVEVHQRVAAGEQVDVGDRGVLDQVVAPEDHARGAAPCGTTKRSPTGSKYRSRSSAGTASSSALGVRRRAGVGQRLLVDVGGVDLDPLAELPSTPDRLGQHHRQGVGLLAEAQPALQTRIGWPARGRAGRGSTSLARGSPRPRGRGRSR